MVEMKRYIFAALAVVAGIFGASGQQRTVIEGLEGNTEYRTLIKEEKSLVKIADSLAVEISRLRSLLRADTLGRAANSAAIVRMEEVGFEIRSRMARLASRINTIEQEWILLSLAGMPADTTRNNAAFPNEEVPAGTHSRNLVYGSYFSEALSPEQSAELLDAQRAESTLPPLFEQYRRDRESLEALAGEYGRVATQAEADSLARLFHDLSASTEATGQRIDREWGAIFDSKSYIYNLLADKQNRRDLLDSFERGMERVREEFPRHAEAPAAPVNYVLQKRMLTDYETELAGALGNRPAFDSLRLAAARIPEIENLARLAPIGLKERLFLDYSDIKTGGSPYNTSNPIPEVAVWPKGIMWRVQVGNFSTRQSPSVFRGAHPIAVATGDEGRFRYFAGGFPTDSLAGRAVEQLRKAGFRAPSVVVWMDGVYIDPADADERRYRVEISGVGELSAETREIIASATKEGAEDENTPNDSTDDGAPRVAKAEIVRAAGAFIVTPLDGTSAILLRTALEAHKAAYPEMEVRLSKNPE
jgi:hypothetical protein